MESLSEDEQKVLGKATARLAHEIRNSLTGLSGAFEVLKDRLPGQDGYEDVLVRVEAEIGRIRRAVDELTRFSEPLRPARLEGSIHEVIERALARTPLGASIRVNKRYQVGLPSLPFDDKLIGQAVERILANARDAMPEGGTLTISTACDENHVLISIRDTGRGIPEDQLPRVLEPFVTDKPHGLGLGLAITQELVRAHGGTLSVRSAKGKGTEFVITLPRTE